MEKIRLQKIFTDCGIMSRRNAEKEIASGNVTVNGQIASLGDKADITTDVIVWNGRKIKSSKPFRTHTYIMLNKPLGFPTTVKDEKGRATVMNLVSDVDCRIYPVGRLDMFSEGLLLMTNDGDLTNKLTHPSHNIGKVYTVKVKGKITDDELACLKAPMTIDGYKLRPVKVRLISRGKKDIDGNTYSSLEITLFEGRNRQIRKMCEKCNITVMRLCRTRFGELELGELESGTWRHLTEAEIEYLKNI